MSGGCWAAYIKGLALCLLLALSSSPTAAAEKYLLRIQSQTIEQALHSLAGASGKQLLFPYGQMKTLKPVSLSGRYTINEALNIILQDSSLSGALTTDGVILITPIQTNKGIESMNTKKNILASTIAFFMGAAVQPGVVAQETASDGETAWLLEEVVVTATKREEKLIDVPISITAMSGEKIDNAGIQGITDLSYAVPNLSVWERGPGLQTITIRGIGNERGSSSLVGIYLDDIPVSAIPIAQLDLQTSDLSRVEVLKGPQGTLYGQGSVGGTVRFITNDPHFDGVDGKLDTSVYDTKKGGLSEEVTAIVNLPVIDDKLAFKVAATYKNKSGWIDQPAVDKEDINNHELTNIRLKGLLQATDDLTVKGTAIHHRSQGGGINVVNLGPVSDSNFQAAVDPTASPQFTDDYSLYNITFNYDLNFATLTSASSYVDIDRTFQSASQFAFFAFDSTVVTEISARDGIQEAEVLAQELRLNSNESSLFDWTAGVFYSDLEYLESNAGGAFVGAFNGNTSALMSINASKSIAFFGDISYEFTDRLTVGLGVRSFEDERTLEDNSGQVFEETFDHVSSRAYLSFAMTDDANLYFSASEGFRSGGFNTVAGVGPYDPETVLSYELGAKALLADGRISVDAAIFHSIYDDIQVLAFDPSVFQGVIQNVGEAEISGIEWALQWAATSQFTFSFSGNITDGEYTKITSSPATQNEGDPLDFVPEYSYSVSADYAFDWSKSMPGFARLDFNRQGQNSVVNRTAGLAQQVFHSESISFLNAHVGAQWDAVTVTLFGKNLLDEDRVTTAVISALGPQNRPRSVGIKAVYEF